MFVNIAFFCMFFSMCLGLGSIGVLFCLSCSNKANNFLLGLIQFFQRKNESKE